jgi:hypothetical protein
VGKSDCYIDKGELEIEKFRNFKEEYKKIEIKKNRGK